MSLTHDTASPVHGSSSSASSSSNNFFATKNLFKLFTKKSKDSALNVNNKKKISLTGSGSGKRIPFVAYNLQVNDSSNLVLVQLVLKRSSNTVDYGFTIVGYCPCQVGKIEQDSVASKAGLLVGDSIIKVNSNNVTRATSESIVKMIKNSTEQIALSVYRNPTKQQQQSSSTSSNIPKLIQGDQAATCIINSTENDFFLSKSSDLTSANNKRSASASTTTTTSNIIANQQQHFTKFLKTTPIESFKSDDFIYYAGGSGVSINYPKKSATAQKQSKTRRSKRHGNKHNKENNNNNDDSSSANASTISDLPSPIPYLPPLSKKKRKQQQQQQQQIENELLNLIAKSQNDNNNLLNGKKSTLTDSDYKTQSSSTTDIASSSNEYRQANHQQQKINDFELDENDNNDDEFDSERMDACEQLLHLEEKFIEKMQKGVQQYSRPLRHCMMINTSQHHLLFQNIEKILAISEYQLNQLISQDDSTLITMFNSIGKLYENKMRMSCEAFDIYLNGIDTAFQLLDNLMRMPNFGNFIQDSKEDINMDLKTFLLLPLTYVGNVWNCLNMIRERTTKTSCDYMPINTVLQSLDVYVKKSRLNLNKYSILIDGDDDEQQQQHQQSSSVDADNHKRNEIEEENEVYEDDEEEEEEAEDDGYDFSKLNSRFLIHSSKLNYRLLKKNKWNKIHTLLFKDALAFMSKDFDEHMFNTNNKSDSYLNYISTIIQLKDIVKYDFDLDNNEFQLIYTNYNKNSSNNNYYSINFKTSTIEEKHKWKKLLNHCIQQTKRKTRCTK